MRSGTKTVSKSRNVGQSISSVQGYVFESQYFALVEWWGRAVSHVWGFRPYFSLSILRSQRLIAPTIEYHAV